MHLKFDSEKAIEAAAVIARKEGKRIGRLRLLKLMYIADRKALKERGRPILGSKSVAMNHGPLHSELYSMLKGEHPASSRWSEYFTQDGPRRFRLTEEPSNRCLSASDIAILNDVVDSHESIDDWTLSEMTHDFKEWVDNFQENTSTTIPVEDIIAAVGRSDDKESILEDMKDEAIFDKFFESAS